MKVFISYRRDDSRSITERLYDHLVRHLGRDNVFKDVTAIAAGRDFRVELRSALANK
jgi:hypothetical protein